jgi:hypothetical protein
MKTAILGIILITGGMVYADDLYHTGSCSINRVSGLSEASVTSGANTSWQSPKVFTYQCTRCGLLEQFTIPGVHRCPNDGTYMVLH